MVQHVDDAEVRAVLQYAVGAVGIKYELSSSNILAVLIYFKYILIELYND